MPYDVINIKMQEVDLILQSFTDKSENVKQCKTASLSTSCFHCQGNTAVIHYQDFFFFLVAFIHNS